MLKPAKIRYSFATYWRYSKRHKWHVQYAHNCHYAWRPITHVERYFEAQILYDMRLTRPPGDFCKACFKSSHFKVAPTIEDCR